MAEDDTERTEDPTQKRLDDAHAKGDVAKSQEVNTWFVIAGATLVLSTFCGAHGRRHPGADAQPDRQFLDDPHRWPRAAATGAAHRIRADRGDRRAVPDADAGGDRRQHDPASPGLVDGIAQAQAQQDFARRRLQAHVRQAGGGEFPERPVQADRARRGHDRGAVAGAASSRGHGAPRSGGDHGHDHRAHHASAGRGRRHARRRSRSPTTSSSTGNGTSVRR